VVTTLRRVARGIPSTFAANKEDRRWPRDCSSIDMTQLVEFLQYNQPSSKENYVSE
jgi:hypothetical protein